MMLESAKDSSKSNEPDLYEKLDDNILSCSNAFIGHPFFQD